MRSTCCDAPRHPLFSDCCSDCKEWAEFFDEEDQEPLSPPTDEEIQMDLDWCERERFQKKLEPAFKALNDLLYNSIRLQHESMIAGDTALCNIQMARANGIRDSIAALILALKLELKNTDNLTTF